MNRALIVLGGQRPARELLCQLAEETDYVLCADRGLDAALEAGIRIDGAIGDFDSAKPTSVAEMNRRDIPHIVYPAIKDDTDGMACVRFVLDNDVKEVVLTGASGGRIDHYLANFQLLVYLEKHGVRACIEEENMTAWAVHDREQTVVGHMDDLLSVLQMTEELQLSESGVFYPLDHYDVEFGYPIGVSNVMTAKESVITVHKGWALIIHYKNKPEPMRE